MATSTSIELAPPRTKRLSMRQREAIACALFIAPAVIGFIAFTIVPLGIAAVMSVMDQTIAAQPRFVGLANYQAVMADGLFWQSISVTLRYAALIVPSWIISSLALALLLNQPIRGAALFRTIFYLPAVLSGIVVAMLFGWIFNARVGLLNSLLALIGIKGPNWLNDPNTALFALVLVGLWGIGWYVPIWLGGLQSIPTELFEAAELDGAGALTRLRHITLPMLSPIILYNLVINIIWALQLFTEPFVLTDGGPRFTTLSYVLYMYNNAFEYGKMGQALAQAWLLFLATVLLAALVFRSTPMWVHYESQREEN